MTHSLSGFSVTTKASLLEDVSSWLCPGPDVCLSNCVVEGVYDWPGDTKFKGVTQLQRGDVDEVPEGNSKIEEST